MDISFWRKRDTVITRMYPENSGSVTIRINSQSKLVIYDNTTTQLKALLEVFDVDNDFQIHRRNLDNLEFTKQDALDYLDDLIAKEEEVNDATAV